MKGSLWLLVFICIQIFLKVFPVLGIKTYT